MKRKRFSVEQIAGVLKQVEVGVPVAKLSAVATEGEEVGLSGLVETSQTADLKKRTPVWLRSTVKPRLLDTLSSPESPF